jgi:ribosome-binding ATPase YchF (GTP1/OBG family)
MHSFVSIESSNAICVKTRVFALLALSEMSAEDAAAYLAKHKLKSQVPKIIVSGYHALGLGHYFTCGEVASVCSLQSPCIYYG